MIVSAQQILINEHLADVGPDTPALRMRLTGWITPAQASDILHCNAGKTLPRYVERGWLRMRWEARHREYWAEDVYKLAESGARTPRARAAVKGSPAGARGGTGAPPGSSKTPVPAVSEGCTPVPD